MSRHVDELALRRAALIARCGEQRARLVADGGTIGESLAWIDRGVVALRWVADRPWLVVAGVATLVAWRPRSLARFAERAFVAAWLVVRVRGILTLLPLQAGAQSRGWRSTSTSAASGEPGAGSPP